VWFFQRVTKAHSQEWLCYENRSLVDLSRNLFSLRAISKLDQIQNQLTEQAAEKVIYFVIPSGARNLSSIQV
jgi:hypothetical protein